jgi:hypothetical protein
MLSAEVQASKQFNASSWNSLRTTTRSVGFRRLHCGSASNIAEARWLGVEQAGSSVAVLGYPDVLARYYFCQFWALPAP